MKSTNYMVFIVLMLNLANINAQSGLDIIMNYQDSVRVNNVESTITYKNISKKGRMQQRTLKQYISKNAFGKNTYNLLLKFISPMDVAGTGTLTIQYDDREDDQWLYLPAIGSSRKISASKKTSRFMGTEMTYEDLSNYLSEVVEKHRYTLLRKDMEGEKHCYVIRAECVDPDLLKTTGYAYRDMWIEENTFQNLQTLFYDRQGNLLKIYSVQQFQRIGDQQRIRPVNIRMENFQTGNKTEVIYSEIVLNESIDNRLFSRIHLETK